MSDFKEIVKRLSRPFSTSELKWRCDGKPANGQVYVIPYIDARVVMDRLDDVIGMKNWHATFELLPGGMSAACTIHVRYWAKDTTKEDDCTFSKTDVGSASDGTKPDLIHKAAYSDAMKRAAVHLGIGRYLYALSGYWVKADANGYPLHNPVLPDWAMNEEDLAAAVKAREEAKSNPPAPVAQPQQPAKPQTQRLGGDGREQPPVELPPPPVEITLPLTQPINTHQQSFVLLGPDDKSVVIPIANAIGAAVSSNSRELLRRYYDAYKKRENITQVGFEYLDAFMWEAWSRTTGPQYYAPVAKGGA